VCGGVNRRVDRNCKSADKKTSPRYIYAFMSGTVFSDCTRPRPLTYEEHDTSESMETAEKRVRFESHMYPALSNILNARSSIGWRPKRGKLSR